MRRWRSARLLGRGAAAGIVVLGACGDQRDSPVDAGATDARATDAQNMDARTMDATFDATDAMHWDQDAGVPIDAGDGRHLFDDDIVVSYAAARRVLYSWTTDAQAAELRRDQVLLTRSQDAVMGMPNVTGVIANLAASGDVLAGVLMSEPFQKIRFAWPSPWATLQGWPGESYGRRLLRIVLRPEAWIARLDAAGLSVFDMANRPVPLDDVLATPDRLGAIYFVNEGEAVDETFAQCSGSFLGCATGAYREYVVNNPAMIEEWSLETSTIRRELVRNIQVVEAFQRVLDGDVLQDACSFSSLAICEWRETPTWQGTGWRPYLNAICITSDLYQPRSSSMRDLAHALRECLFDPDPLVVRP